MRFLYSFFIFCYGWGIKLAALFNPKAKLWVKGRINIFEKLELEFDTLDKQAPLTWMHCASLGEFEQGRPLLEKIKFLNPNSKILLTFFSPSGFEIRKNYAGADWVFYLPLDSYSNAKRFVELVKPDKVIFVKYEFWFNYLEVLSTKKISTYFISVNVRPDHYFLKWYGSWALNRLKTVTHFFVQNKSAYDLLSKAGINACTIAGDTRFDRVIAISKSVKSIPGLADFCGDKKIIVAGSTWRDDEKILATWMLNKSKDDKEKRLIIAPHEINEKSLQEVEQIFSASKIIRYSAIKNKLTDSYEILLIDNIGMLSSVYNYSTICYIGGGFGKGIHNVLEAAVFGKPLVFGPSYQKFEEAKTLLNLGGATSVSSHEELNTIFSQLLSDEKKYREQSLITQKFVHDNAGAVNRILEII